MNGIQNKHMTWEEFFKLHPEYKEKKKPIKKKKYQFLCQCKQGHVFDYRERKTYSKSNYHYAPYQGKCPVCGCSEFSFIGSGTNVYPIKWNFTG